MKIAIASYIDTGRYESMVPDEDQMLLKLFKDHNHDVELLVWDNPDVHWEKYDCVIIKSTWDYFIGKINKFYDWLEMLKAKNIQCLNHPDIIKWNADKHYLLDIEKAGQKIVPTIIVEKGNKINIEEAFNKFNTNEIVVKPCVSGAAMNTFRINKNYTSDVQSKINELLLEDSYIIQPLKKEILEEGEWSFVYFNGRFSHHLLKSGKGDDFRVQHFWGGSINTPPYQEEMLEQANKYIEHFAKGTLYARVDAVWSNNQLELMELELIEPYLFFFTNDQSLSNYYIAFTELYNSK
jgi:glutathione synthase/RimK-type ligase-like ATP-grasp enzyme